MFLEYFYKDWASWQANHLFIEQIFIGHQLWAELGTG